MFRYRVIIYNTPKVWEYLGHKTISYMKYLSGVLTEQFGNNWQIEFNLNNAPIEEDNDWLWYNNTFDKTILRPLGYHKKFMEGK